MFLLFPNNFRTWFNEAFSSEFTGLKAKTKTKKKKKKEKRKKRKGIALIGPAVKEETHEEGGMVGGLGLEQGYRQEFKC